MSAFSRIVKLSGSIGAYQIARVLCKKEPRILMYHRFSSSPCTGHASQEFFQRQVMYIKNSFSPLTVSEMIQDYHLGSNVKDHVVSITVDDGYRDFYDFAFPILKAAGVPATVYVTTGFIDKTVWLWPDRVRYILENTTEIAEPFSILGLQLCSGHLDDENKDDLNYKINSYLLTVPEHKKNEIINKVAVKCGVSLPAVPPERFAPMTWEQLREIQAAGIEVGGHTVTHPSLGHVDDFQCLEEIKVCKERLDSELGVRPRSFCFPNGQKSDYKEYTKNVVREAGFIGAVTAFPDRNGVRNQYEMRRHVGGDDMFQFYKSVSGLEYFGKIVRG